jgi:hypothetical protein
MKLADILEKYDTVLLDQISSDKVDETISLRLPRPVIIQEIVTALSSLSYISEKIGYAKPPNYAILDLILHAPDYTVEVEDFRDKVLEHVSQLTAKRKCLKIYLAQKTIIYILRYFEEPGKQMAQLTKLNQALWY